MAFAIYTWALIASAFNTAFDVFISQRSSSQEYGAETWGQGEKDLTAAGLAVASFISGDPGIVREKQAMATCLREWSSKLNGKWSGGLADLIDASNRELPTRLRAKGDDLYPTPQHMPAWPPACEFWGHVKKLDAAIDDAARAVLEATPMTDAELCDKILIAAFTGGLKLMVRTASVGPLSDPADLGTRIWMRRLRAATNLHCRAALMYPRTFDEIVGTARTDPFISDLRPAELVRVVLGLADHRWHRAIWSDAKRLGLVSDRRSGSKQMH